jgi:transposase
MSSRHGPVHVATIVNRQKGKVYKTHLLRRVFRDGKHVRHETLGNISHLPEPVIELVRRALKGETFVSAEEVFQIIDTKPHGHVEAVLRTFRKLGLAEILGSKPCRERDLVLAMIAQRVIAPKSKLATSRDWTSTTLAEELGVEGADVNELYAALDWLLERKGRIEAKLAKRHLAEGCQALYDVSSSYYEGHTCPLAKHGHNRDGKRGRPIIVYGMLTDRNGRPVAVEVYPGNTADPTTVPDQVAKLRERFELNRVVLVGDRGMLTTAQVDKLKQYPGLGWISSLRSDSIRQLMKDGVVNRSLFDETNLAEIESADFLGERLVACYNPLLADRRSRKRELLLAATEKELVKLAAQVQRRTRTPMSAADIGKKAGAIIQSYKVGKHFVLEIEENAFRFRRDQDSIDREAQLDGIYVVRTGEKREDIPAEDVVRDYKGLGNVEQAFRSLKSDDLRIRPIFHRVTPRVEAHIFLCMLSYYVQWHLKRAWEPLLFAEEDLSAIRQHRDPVAKAEPTLKARKKKVARVTDGGFPVHSFDTLLRELARRSRNTCQIAGNDSLPQTFQQLTHANALQAEALRLIDT